MTAIIRKVTEIGLGDNADTTKNFKILVPDVADGTLKITRGDGTAVLNIDAAGRAVFPGNAQTWQDKSASRIIGQPYTNDTLLPIKLVVLVTGTSSFIGAATISGIGQIYGSYATASPWASTVCAEVPAGATYTINGGTAVNNWKELR